MSNVAIAVHDFPPCIILGVHRKTRVTTVAVRIVKTVKVLVNRSDGRIFRIHLTVRITCAFQYSEIVTFSLHSFLIAQLLFYFFPIMKQFFNINLSC